jgi:hypothetical protein
MIARLGFFDSTSITKPTDSCYIQIRTNILKGTCNNAGSETNTTTSYTLSSSSNISNTQARSIITDDTMVVENSPASNFGSNPDMGAYSRNVNRNQRVYLEINLSKVGITSTSQITNATLAINIRSTSTSASVVIQHKYCNDVFNEANITWNNQATEVKNCDSGSFYNITTTSYPATNSFITIPMASIITTKGNLVFTIQLITNPESFDATARGVDFRSSENTTSSSFYAPRLNLIYGSGGTNEWYNGVIEVNKNASRVSFSLYDLDNVKLWNNTISSNIPNQDSTLTGFGVQSFETSTSNYGDLLLLDYIGLEINKPIVR